MSDARSAEAVVAEFVASGVLHVAEDGSVWRLKQKVGGARGPRWKAIRPVPGEKRYGSRMQVQVWLDGERIVCASHRLVWFLANGEIPPGYHIHHIDGDMNNNCLANLSCETGSEHIRRHLLERVAAGHLPWNKGLTKADPRVRGWHERTVAARRANKPAAGERC